MSARRALGGAVLVSVALALAAVGVRHCLRMHRESGPRRSACPCAPELERVEPEEGVPTA